MALLEMKGITKLFYGIPANDHIDLSVEESEIHALLGENGAGKTTLMNILYGLYHCDEGEIWWNGVKQDFQKPLDAIACGIGMVHQHFMLVRPMTVLQNIILGMKVESYPFIKKKDIAKKIKALSQKYGLAVDVDKRIDELSVGEQQRVEILKALYRNAKLLVLDEPTAGLDPVGVSELMHLLQDVCRQQNTTIILSTHDIDVVPIYADVIDVMDQGHVIAHGTPEEIFAQPELLRSHHLRLPRISHLLEILQKEDGWDVDASVSTISGARKELLRHAAN